MRPSAIFSYGDRGVCVFFAYVAQFLHVFFSLLRPWFSYFQKAFYKMRIIIMDLWVSIKGKKGVNKSVGAKE